jgi:hypothetical protein
MPAVSGPEQPHRPAATSPVQRLGLAVCVALVFAGLHARSLDYPFLWTDISAIGGRSMLRPPAEIGQAFSEPLHRIAARDDSAAQLYYRPLQVALLSAVDAAFGGEPRHFRAATVAVGAACVAIWSALAFVLTGSLAAAAFAALFVAVHPVTIEATTWISGSSGTLSGLFSLAAIGLAWRCTRSRSRGGTGLLGAASGLALLLALLAKERAAVEPLLLAAVLIVCREGSHSASRTRGFVVVGAHAAFAFGYMALWRASVVGALPAVAPIEGSYAVQIATSVAHWPAALAWVLVPWQSTTSDVVPIVRSFADLRFAAGAILALGSAWAAWWLLRRSPLVALGIVWIWIAFAPTAGLIPMLHASGERYLLLSSFGAALLWTGVGRALAQRMPANLARPITVSLGIAGMLLVAQRSWQRLPDWQSTAALFGTAVERQPEYREGRFLLARDAFERGDHTRAAEQLDALFESTEAAPSTHSYLNWLSTYELACANRLARGDGQAAVALERRAARHQPGVARAITFRTCIGQARDALGQTDLALAVYLEAAEQLGDQMPPRLAVMITRNLIALGRTREARTWIVRARTLTTGMPNLQRQIQRLDTQLRRR